MRLAAALLALALVLGSCGGGDDSSPEEVVTAWLEDLGEGRAAQACGAMTEAGRRELVKTIQLFAAGDRGEGDCERQAEHFANGRGAPKDLDTRVVSEDGDRATVATEGEGPGTVQLRREDGEWRIDRFLSVGWRALGIPPYPGGLPDP